MDDSVPHLRGMQWCRCTRSVLKLFAHDLWYQTFCPAHWGLRWCRCARSVLQKSKSNHKTCMKRSCCLEKLFLYFWTKWLCFFREWFVSFKNRSLPCSRCQTGTRCGLVAAPNLHPQKNSPTCSEKKSEWNDCDSKLFMSFHVKWLKMLKLVGMRHCWQMVEAWTWWKCQFLTNLWNVEITPPKKKHVLPFVGPRQSSTHKCVRKIVANRWRPPNSANCWKC